MKKTCLILWMLLIVVLLTACSGGGSTNGSHEKDFSATQVIHFGNTQDEVIAYELEAFGNACEGTKELTDGRVRLDFAKKAHMYFFDGKTGKVVSYSYDITDGAKQREAFKQAYGEPDEKNNASMTWYGKINGVAADLICYPDLNGKNQDMIEFTTKHNQHTVK